MELVTPQQMRDMDARAIETIGLPGVVLMEHAALGAVDVLLEHFAPEPGARIGLLCGGGNNGGDGYAMARLLQRQGFVVQLVALSDPAKLRGDARVNAQIAMNLGLPLLDLHDTPPEEISSKLATLPSCEVWCDALLGTGLDRPVAGRYTGAIEFLNRQRQVLAVDLPSGLNAFNGQVMGTCVRAHATATFAFPKIGQVIDPGRLYTGRLYTVDIGMPAQVVRDIGTYATWSDEPWAKAHMPRRAQDAHKGTAGRIFVVAGSPRMLGAALLTSRAALEGGAGLVTLGTHEAAYERVAPALPGVMACPVYGDHAVTPTQLEELTGHLERADVVVVGPGMQEDDVSLRLLERALERTRGALVLDATALRLVAAHELEAALTSAATRHPVVITPHPGEMAGLCGLTTRELLEAPLAHAEAWSERTGCVVVLKLATTIITGPDGRVLVNGTGNEGMASAGMGDTLAGLIAARLAETSDAWIASGLATWAHGAAGDLARDEVGVRGVTASRLLAHLPALWRRLGA